MTHNAKQCKTLSPQTCSMKPVRKYAKEITNLKQFGCFKSTAFPDRNFNKKLHYREEHSASVVLSWCTLWHFSGENLLMANQPHKVNGSYASIYTPCKVNNVDW